MSEVELFLEVRHQVKSFAGYIGESLAKNYRKGLNGSYRNRLEKGVQVAVRAKSGALVEVINKLLKDREQKGARTVVDIPKSELAMRALVLGLWSSRPVYIGRQDKVQLGSNQVYGDKFYDPPIDLSGTGEEAWSDPRAEEPPVAREKGVKPFERRVCAARLDGRSRPDAQGEPGPLNTL